jgi:chorismate synthase
MKPKMDPSNSSDPALLSGEQANAAVQRVIAVIDELAALIAQENQILARGIPASLAGSVVRKHELADMFETKVKEVIDQQLFLRMTDGALRRELMARVKSLRASMTENTDRLRAAIDATRRRVDSVMRAIRAEVAGKPTSYGPNGKFQESRAALSVRCSGVNA